MSEANMSQVKAVVTKIKLGAVEIDGLMLPDGNFGVSYAQLAHAGLIPPNRSSKQLGASLGIALETHKISSELHPNLANYFTLVELEYVLQKIAFTGNSVAQELLSSLVGLSLTQLFSDAFGVKFDKEERQGYLTARAKARRQHQPCLTKHWCELDGIESGLEYAIRTKTMKAACGIPTTLGVNDFSEEQLFVWGQAQSRYGNARELGLLHKEAVEFVKKLQKY